jgi:hypothetical protein
MQRGFVITIAGLLFIVSGFLLASCTPDKSAPTFDSQQTAALTPEATEPQTVAMAQQSPTPVVPPFTDTACLDCHTDRPVLEELAVGAESDHHAGEALSSGPG